MTVTIVLWMLVLVFPVSARAQSPAIDIRAVGEHRTANGDTPDSARRLALADAQRRARQAAVTQLQRRSDVKDLRLTQFQTEAFTAVLLDLEEAPPPAGQPTRVRVEAQVRGRLDGADAARKMARLRKDQDVTYVLADLDRDVESAAALREVIRINPDHYNARYNLGELFRLEGKYDELGEAVP